MINLPPSQPNREQWLWNLYSTLAWKVNGRLIAETATIPFWVMEEASYLEANLGEPVQAEVVTDEDGYVTRPKFQDAPTVCKAPPKKQSKNSCNKHTRCSCAQFSKQIAGLFDVGKC